MSNPYRLYDFVLQRNAKYDNLILYCFGSRVILSYTYMVSSSKDYYNFKKNYNLEIINK